MVRRIERAVFEREMLDDRVRRHPLLALATLARWRAYRADLRVVRLLAEADRMGASNAARAAAAAGMHRYHEDML